MDLSRWLRRGSAMVLLVVAVGLAAAEPRPVRAQAAPSGDAVTVEELARTIGELQRAVVARDGVIDAMQRRMDEMERRLAVTASAASPAQPTPPPSAPVKPQAPEPPETAEDDAVAETAPPAPPPAAPAPGQIEADEAAADGCENEANPVRRRLCIVKRELRVPARQ